MNMTSASTDKPIQILMIEDCKTDVMLFQHLLGPIEHQCHITDVARMIDAFKQIDDNAYDLILLDLNLLDLDGIANIAAIKAECPHTPIVVYSGRNDARLMQEARTIGAAGYIVKGETSAPLLQHTVARALAH